ncbi:hypothetical protein EVAR_20008_1 [Eumeta japonica]|uniref:Uncharacterized protein n=1 Tax=Eumeta variegata TaxID=151549 RepID=A0A4C1V9G1_EUMVA|nr:hypothetical protein EVAR_20008_1 [Eumeta japonica]
MSVRLYAIDILQNYKIHIDDIYSVGVLYKPLLSLVDLGWRASRAARVGRFPFLLRATTVLPPAGDLELRLRNVHFKSYTDLAFRAAGRRRGAAVGCGRRLHRCSCLTRAVGSFIAR